MNRQNGLFSASPQAVAAFSLAHREIVRSLNMGYALSGKTALVTGANRGIGEAIVDALVAAGVKKVYAAARNISTLDPLVDRHGSRVVPLQLDVTNAPQIAAAAATATDVDLLVNNAGIVGFFGGEFTDPKWIEGGRQEMEVNFLGTFAVTQAFAPVLAKNGGGAIANLNSVASFVSFPILAAYSASKAATHSLTQVTRAMLRGQNTQVFGVYPGPIDTRMGEALNAEKASPADAARAIVAGIIAGNEEIFPDKTSQGVGPAFFADPKGLERQVAGVPAAA
jgi:NAD(P)-dependent dehydrogenase (short-subunit alcohol dehydrogenase family)